MGFVMQFEILKDNRLKKEMRTIFAGIRNPRRCAILDDLCTYEGLTLEQIARNLRKRKYYHSRSTIQEYYLKPLIKGGLIEPSKQGLYRITCLGEKIQRELRQIEEYTDLLNQGKCYEEFFLTALAMSDTQMSYGQLAEIVPMHTIARIEKRIEPLIKKHAARTYYYLTEEGKNGNAFDGIPSTGIDIFHLIKEKGTKLGIPATELFEQTTLRPRTTYKHLKRLKEHRLIGSRKQSVTFSLTPSGKKVADALKRISTHIFFEKEKTTPKTLIIDYLNTQTHHVAAHELVGVLDNYFQVNYGRVTELCEVEQLINELKVEGRLEGNRGQGYKLIDDLEQEDLTASHHELDTYVSEEY